MLTENRKIDVGQRSALLVHEMAEVRRRPQIAHCGGRTIAAPLKRRGETVHVWSAWPFTQVLKDLHRRKICLQHLGPSL